MEWPCEKRIADIVRFRGSGKDSSTWWDGPTAALIKVGGGIATLGALGAAGAMGVMHADDVIMQDAMNMLSQASGEFPTDVPTALPDSMDLAAWAEENKSFGWGASLDTEIFKEAGELYNVMDALGADISTVSDPSGITTGEDMKKFITEIADAIAANELTGFDQAVVEVVETAPGEYTAVTEYVLHSEGSDLTSTFTSQADPDSLPDMLAIQEAYAEAFRIADPGTLDVLRTDPSFLEKADIMVSNLSGALPPDNRLERITDGMGNAVTIVRDASGTFMQVITDQSGNVVGAVTDSYNNVVSFVQDASGTFVQVIRDASGAVVDVAKDAYGNIVDFVTTDPPGAEAKEAFDSAVAARTPIEGAE